MCSPQTKALQVADVSQNSSVPVFHRGVVATPFTGAAETAGAALELAAHAEHFLQKNKKPIREHHHYTLSITFQHPPPNSARIGSATEVALFISAQLSTDAVSTFQKV